MRLGAARRIFFGNSLSVNPDAAAALAADKTYAAQTLAAAGLPVPRGRLVVSDRLRAALALKSPGAAKNLPSADLSKLMALLNYPVFVKPNRGAEGADVTKAHTAAELEEDLHALLSHTTHARVEEAVPGEDLRLLVWDGQVRAAYSRRPLSVTGDGQSTLRALIDAQLSRRPRAPGIDRKDTRLKRSLRQAGMTEDNILTEGRHLALLPNANLSTGGSLEDRSDSIAPALANLAVRAAHVLGLRLAGVDLMAQGPDATVLEVNSAPGLDGFARLSDQTWQQARDILREVLESL